MRVSPRNFPRPLLSHLFNRTPQARRILGRGTARIAGIALILSSGIAAWATATTTSLTVSPSTPVTAQTDVILTATVLAGSTPVAGGTVDFYDTYSPGLPIGSSQLTSAGKAVFRTVFTIGVHSLTAKFEARGTYAASASAAQPMTVTAKGNIAFLSNLMAQQVQGTYTLTNNLSFHAKAGPTGSVNFVSPSNSNASLGTSPLTFQSLNFDPYVLYSTGTADGASSVVGVAAGDFNNDGIPDLAVSNNNSQIVIFLGNGDGTFAAGVPYTAGTEPGEPVAVDLNGDGNLDLICIDNYTGAMLVMLGNGDGTFQAATSPINAGGNAMVVADVNGDGKLDLVFVNGGFDPGFGGAPIAIALGNGDGTFQAAAFLTNTFTDVNADAIAIADLNGDGIPDIIFANQGYSGMNMQDLSVMLGKGDGTFANPVDYALPGNPTGLAIADLNGDGIPDVVVNSDLSTQDTYVLLGKAGGTLAAAATYTSGSFGGAVLIGDFNGDGKLDLAVPINDYTYGNTYVNVLPGKGDGTFGTAYSVAGGSGTGAPLAADLDGSGMLSFVAGTEDSGLSVTLANSNYSAEITGVLVTSMETAQADYSAGASDPYKSGKSNVETLYPSQYYVSFSTPPPTTLTAGQAPGAVGVTVYVDGQVLTVKNETVTLIVTGPDDYSPSYSAVSSNGIATFTTLPPLTKAGNYVYFAGSSSVVLIGGAEADETVVAGVTTPIALAIVNKFPTPANPGVATPWTIAAVDKNGNAVATFTGAVTISSSDAAATFTPVSHTFVAADAGVYTFQIALKTAGTQSLTATSTGLTSVSQTGITVASATVKTTLAVSPASPAATRAVETLTATVVNGSSPQYPGTVAFYDSSRLPALIGTAQLSTSGVAQFKTVLPVGTHPLTATFNGTATAPSNPSASLSYVVNGTEAFATSGLLTSTQSPGYTTLLDAAGFFAQPKPTGQVQFIDGNSGNVLGSLTPTGPYYDFVVETYDTRVGTSGYALAAGDINGDGILDVVAVNSASTDNTVTVYLGNGFGYFTQTQVYAVGHSPTGIALADFNNDGILDLIVTNTGDDTADVLLGKGDGTFGLPISVSTGASPTAVVVADVNQDGNLDALITNSGSNTISILYGNGDGTFKSQSTLTVGNAPNGIAIADFNEDGIPDLAVTSLKDSAFTVLFGKGGNQFDTPLTIETEGGTSAIVAADFGSGHQDVAVTIPSMNLTDAFSGAGNGTFEENGGVTGGNNVAQPMSLAVGDFNQDGILDLAIGYAGATGSGVITVQGNPGGFLDNVTQQMAFGQSVLGLVSGDFLNDGLPTLVATNKTIPSYYNLQDQELAISSLADAQTYSLTLTPVNIPDTLQHAVYAKYVPGPNDAYVTSFSNSVLVSGSLAQSVLFTPNLPTTTFAGQLPGGAVTVEVVTDGEVESNYNGPVQVTIVGFSLFYTQSYTVNAVDGYADFTSTIVAPTEAGLYVYYCSIPNTNVQNSSYGITVLPGASSQLVLSNPYITPAATGVPGVVGVSVEDQYGNPTPAFTGTVTLTTSDTAAVISPATHTFTSADNGYAPFAVTFKTVGTQSITATTSGLTTNTAKQSNIVVLAPSVSTSTALKLSASGSVPAETAETLTATVQTGASKPVTQGVVDFIDAAATPKLIATGEVNSSGTATATLILPVGTHSLTASLEAQNAFAASTSSPVPLTVDPVQNYITQTTLAATGSEAGYTLNADLLAYGKAPPTATTLMFQDTSNSNADLGSANLGAATYGLLPQVTFPTGGGPTSVAVADFSGDGIEDLVITNSNDETVAVEKGNGDGTFGAPKVIFTYSASYTQQVLAGDFNGDGKPDFALLNGDGSIFIALGNGDGTFAAPKQVLAPPDPGAFNFNAVPYAMVLGDFNRDGRLDIAITDSLDSTVLVLLGYGDGTFQTAVAYAGETTPEGIAVADVNGDGKSDLIVTNSFGNTVSVLLGNGDGTFQQQVTYATGKTPLAVIATDLNGDGAPDLAVVNSADSTVSVLLNKGNGTFAAQTAYPVGTGPNVLTAADFNADGIPDLAVVNEFDSTVSILNGKGNGTFAAQNVMATGGFPTGIAFGDFTGGGLNSLAVTNYSNATVSILLGAQTLPATLNDVVLSGASVHNVDAVYTPGAADPYAPSTSNVVELNGSGLGPSATTTSVTGNPNPGYLGYAVNFTATVASPIGVLATGTVSFYDGATLLGSSNLGTNRQATYSTIALAIGTHNITATYSGDTNYAKSTSTVLVEVVESSASIFTSVNLVSSSNPAVAGSSVSFTATVSPSQLLPALPTGNMTFFDGSSPLVTVKVGSNNSAAFSTSTLASGKHTISAAYTGDANYGGSVSAPLTEVITGGAAATVTTLKASSASVTVGTSVMFTATVTSSASGTPTGSITFEDNGTSIGTGTLSSGTATLSTSALAVGAHPITAVYGGDSNFATSTSSPVSVTVNAAAAPVASLTMSLAFPNTTVNTTSSAMAATLSNTGNATLNIGSVAIGGTNPAEFAITTGANACGATLAASASCSIYVTFKPAAAQAYAATLTVTDNASPTTQQSSLSGTGVPAAAPVASLTTSLAFSNTTVNTTSSAMAATLSNTGNATLNISSVVIGGTNPADFTITTGANACGAALAASASCSIYVTFKPAAAQAYAATLTVTDNASPTTQQSSLSGTGVPAAAPVASLTMSLAFSNTTVNTTSSAMAATLSNTGNATLNISSVAIGGTNPAEFAITTGANACGTTLAASASCSIYVTFKPAAAQAYAATLTVTDNASPTTQSSSLTGTGVTAAAPVASLTGSLAFPGTTVGTTSSALAATLSNTGNATLTISSIAIGGTNPADFAVTTGTNACGTTLAASATCNIYVTFKPAAAQAYAATLTVTDNASPTTQSSSLSGTGVAAAAPVASLTPSLTYPNTMVGTTSSALAATLSNSGNATLNISSIAIGGTNPSDFAISTGSNACGTTLAADASCSIYVTFTPASATGFSATLTVTDNATPTTQSTTLTGTGTPPPAPVASLTPATLTFTAVSGATTAAQTATLSNTGNATLNITGITIAGTNPTDFAITTGANACGTSLAADASCMIYVTFTPASVASFTAILQVADNAAGSPQSTTLNGTGTPPPNFTIGSSSGAQTIQQGGTATYTITVTAQNGTFSNAVALSASGLPTGATGTFTPPSVTPGSSSATSTLSIQTASTATASVRHSPAWPLAGSALAMISLLFLPGKRRRRWITTAILLIASLGAFTALTACGGGFALTQPAQSYTVTVTGTSGTDVQTTTVQLTVQ